MKHIENDVVSFYYKEPVFSSIPRFCCIVKDDPFIIRPLKDINDEVRSIFLSENFQLYPTVKKTTLFYDPASDCFFKILHPLAFKNKILFLLLDKAKSIYNLSEYLLSKDIKVPEIMTYGTIKKGKKPFFVMKKIEGKSLYDILIRERKILPGEMYLNVVDDVARLHSHGYWFGDAHLSHIFVNDSGVSGFIDIDGIKKNRPFRLRNLAKDLAGFNYPQLPISEDKKRNLLKYYIEKSGLKNERKFLQLVKHYTERRWKE